MRAVIDWIPNDQGGRREPPSGIGEPPYSPIVRFPDGSWPPEVAWSLAVRKVQESGGPRGGVRWVADVDFRVHEGPSGDLREGREFELYEGKTCVARGKFVGDAWLLPSPESEISSVWTPSEGITPDSQF